MSTLTQQLCRNNTNAEWNRVMVKLNAQEGADDRDIQSLQDLGLPVGPNNRVRILQAERYRHCIVTYVPINFVLDY
jgi:hypothetical protein